MDTGRVAVIGDVHGQADELAHKLVRMGADPDSLALPDDLTVIQVGDLIHRGLQSSEVLQLVDTIQTNQPAQWIQLIGNHEAQYIHGKLFEWDDELPDEDAAVLQRWLNEGQLHAAASIVTPAGNEALVTHSGLVHDVWRIVLGRPRTARDAAARINAGLQHTTPWLWAPGEMLQGVPNRMAGPMWASAGAELYASWMNAEDLDVPAPFSQVHGHSSIYQWPNRWRAGEFRRHEVALATPSAMERLQARVAINEQLRHTTVTIAGGTFVGVDPNHGRSPADHWAPLLFHGEAEAPAGETPESMLWLLED